MRKTWMTPDISELDLRETAGGPTDPYALDGPVEWNDDLRRWEWPAGES